ncbi:hypothetical protein Lal_00021411 [Lupinus albus]|nr:hypothetical protein Lal_00021411 [Lupinus albus]
MSREEKKGERSSPFLILLYMDPLEPQESLVRMGLQLKHSTIKVVSCVWGDIDKILPSSSTLRWHSLQVQVKGEVQTRKISHQYWVAVVKPGRILYGMGGVAKNTVRKTISIAASKMPI